MKIETFFYSLLKLILTLIQLVILVVGGFLIFISLKDYKPKDNVILSIYDAPNSYQVKDTAISILSWNIGYSGLGKRMDFFYDGGTMVRPERQEFDTYWDGINSFLNAHDSIDFLFLQEVDSSSRRSYGMDEVSGIAHVLENKAYVFARNYDVPFVPMPLTNPMGKVVAGMMTLSDITPIAAHRLALPSAFSWPMKQFMLDRCAVITKYRLDNRDEKLVLINIHNSAYVDDPEALQRELFAIRDVARHEYEEGNFVVVGGDWNQNPPGFIATGLNVQMDLQLERSLFGPDWKWAYDMVHSTNRLLNAPLSDTTKTNVIDFFACSPNVMVDTVYVIPQHFENADHEPVYLQISLP